MSAAVENLLKMMTDAKARGMRLMAGSPARMLDASGAARDASKIGRAHV